MDERIRGRGRREQTKTQQVSASSNVYKCADGETVALILSFAVVNFLNANFFAVYRKISGGDTVKAALLKKGEELEKRVQEQPATNTPSGDATNQQLKVEVAEFRKQQA